MSFTRWLLKLRSSSRHGTTARKSRRTARSEPARRSCLQLECLEDRCMPSFLGPVNYAAGEYPTAIAAADFNGDGRLDLPVANPYSSTVSILLGNGDGTFQPAQNSVTGTNPSSLAVGDFNHDGKLDIVTANAYDMSVLLGNGDGAFQPASNFGIGSDNPLSVAVGDFNGDNTLDLGVTSSLFVIDGYDDWGDPYGHHEGHANVLLGNGDGTFGLPSTTVLNSTDPVSADVADFNGDAKLDVATANFEYGTVSVLLGDGNGNLQAPTDFYAGYYPLAVAAGDVNGDGDIDLLTANFYGNNVSVLLGDGTGGFGAAQSYGDGNSTGSVSLADFNHDGHLDIAARTDNGTVSAVSVLLGKGNGAFSPPVRSPAGTNLTAVATGDFNGDGWLDAATTNFSVNNNVAVLINDHSWPPADAPSVTVNDMTVTEGNTGSTNATFTVSLSAAYGQPVTVHYETANGTATAGSDYTAVSGDVIIAAGQTTRTFTIAVLGDRSAELTENFFVNLSSATNATIADGQGIGTIFDDEPRISINDVTVTEGNTGTVSATFTVSLSVAYDVAVTVHYQGVNGSATAGSDYAAASGEVIIAAGQTTKTFTVAVIGDRSAEPSENFVVNLSAATNGLIVDSQGVGTITDDEPRISISDVTKTEGKKNQTTLFTFTVTLSAAYDQPVTVSFRTTDGTATTGDNDYVARTGTLTFAPGETTKTITIEVKGDNKREADETFYLDLFGNSGNALFTRNRGIGTILNDD